ncbi:GNAT family N-acetyltransferase [Marinibaculum pumilum]|uniref:GNAT family N-acetyltransferase n=1 Tax=Marinibaculum pumilum TaxID=1766165 RepID=A0ABV7L1X5_9PROT
MPAAPDRVTIAGEPPDQPDIVALLQAADRYFAALYAVESNHLLDVERLRAPDVTFMVARRDGVALATGALVDCGGWGEIKRMFVDPAARGLGLGRRMLQALERVAAERGLDPLRLETGIRQPEALALYRAAGYAERSPFGAYRPDRQSVFMERALATG